MRFAAETAPRVSDPLAASLALLTPRGLGRVACCSRLWRDAAARAGAALHIYTMSSHCSAIDSQNGGENYGVAYLGREPPNFDACRGTSGGVLEPSLISRSDAVDDGARDFSGEDFDVEEHVRFSAVTVTCASPAISECVEPVIRALNAAGILEDDIYEEGQINFDATRDLKFVPNRLAHLPRACDFLPLTLIREVAQRIIAASNAKDKGEAWTSIMGVNWARSLLGVAPPDGPRRAYDWGPPLALSELQDRLRVTQFVWETPTVGETPYFDLSFLRVLLRDVEFMGDLCRLDLVDRVFGPRISAAPSTDEKQKMVVALNQYNDGPRRWIYREMLLARYSDPSGGELQALLSEAKFTVPLLDRLARDTWHPMRLNIWRESIRLNCGIDI